MKAVVSAGEIRPLEPLPAEWQDGQPLRVEKAEAGEMSVEDIDRDFALLERLCATSELADEESWNECKGELLRHFFGVVTLEFSVCQ